MSSHNFELLRKFHQVLIKPGTIWRVPVYYSMNYLPETIWLNNDQEICRETDENILLRYWHEKNLAYKSITSETVGVVEVRPLLVISDYIDIVEAGNLLLPTWYADAVVGFPITKTDNLRKRKYLRFNLEKAILKNDLQYLHFIPASKENGLTFDSYVSLSAITFLDKKFFTEKIGSLDSEYDTIVKKFKKQYSL